jgi:hypothetical protein
VINYEKKPVNVMQQKRKNSAWQTRDQEA